MHNLSGPFIIYRATVAGALNLSSNQRNILLTNAAILLRPMTALAAQTELMGVLTSVLTATQWTKFDQLEMQHLGVPNLLDPAITVEMGLTDTQRSEIEGVVEWMDTQIETLTEKTQASGNDSTAWVQGAQIYATGDQKAEQFMTATQRTMWNKLLGKPFPELFDAACI